MALAVGVLGSGSAEDATAPPAIADADAPGRSSGSGGDPTDGTATPGPERPLADGEVESTSGEIPPDDPAPDRPVGEVRPPGASGAPGAPTGGADEAGSVGDRSEPRVDVGSERRAADDTSTGSRPDVAEILERAERAYAGLASLRARFRQTIEVPLMNRRREGHGIWYQKGRGHFRMDFLEPPEDEIVADGTHLWLYYPSTNPDQVIKTTLGDARTEAGTADVLARILDEARTAYEGAYVGHERLAGVETHVISLRPLDPGSPYRRVRVWIGVEDDLVRRFEITEANETVRTVTLTELEPNARISEGTFRFTPPADADVFER